MYFRRLFFSIIFILIPVFSFSAIMSGGGGGFHLGYHFLNSEPLNNSIDDAGFGEFSKQRISFGGGGYWILWNRLMFGGEGCGIYPMDTQSDEYTMKYIGGYGLGNIGVVFLRTENIIIYPMFGFGGYGEVLSIYPESGQFDFDDIINDPRQMTSIENGGLMIAIQGGFDYIFNFSKEKDEMGGIMIGARAGYLYPLTGENWKMNDVEVINGPESPLKGFYIKFTFGGFGGLLP
jgi:hypothetical protein